MTENKKKNNARRRLSKAGRALVIILCLIAAACFGYTGYVIFHPAKTEETSKASRTVTLLRKEALEIVSIEGTVLGETKDAGYEYIDETLFLGDSNTVRYMDFYSETGLTYTNGKNTIAVVGMAVDAISTLNCMQFSTGTFTMVEAVEMLQPRRIIMTFGTNNLDGYTMDPTEFITSYEAQIHMVQEAYPYADIIIQSIYPIGMYNEYPNLNNEQIKVFNAAIMKMCETNEWKYLNTFDDIYDSETGFAKQGMMDTDGLHLSEAGVKEVFRYIRTHAYISEDRRPQPLNDIPEIYGPKTNLYNTNPLNNQPFEFVPEEEPEETPAIPAEVPDEVPEEVPEEPAEPEVPEEGGEEPPAEGE